MTWLVFLLLNNVTISLVLGKVIRYSREEILELRPPAFVRPFLNVLPLTWQWKAIVKELTAVSTKWITVDASIYHHFSISLNIGKVYSQ